MSVINLDALSPKEALDKLYTYVKKIKELEDLVSKLEKLSNTRTFTNSGDFDYLKNELGLKS